MPLGSMTQARQSRPVSTATRGNSWPIMAAKLCAGSVLACSGCGPGRVTEMSRVLSEGRVQNGVRVGPAGPGRASQGRGGQEGQPWSRACPGWVAARVEAECDAWCEVKWRDRGAGRATISCQPVAAVVRGSRAGSCRDIHQGGGREKIIEQREAFLCRAGESAKMR